MATLDYSHGGATKFPWRLLALWLLLIIALSVTHWITTDWWVYLDEGGTRGRVPKFKMPLNWQIGISITAGFIQSSLVIFVGWLAKKILKHVTNKNNA